MLRDLSHLAISMEILGARRAGTLRLCAWKLRGRRRGGVARAGGRRGSRLRSSPTASGLCHSGGRRFGRWLRRRLEYRSFCVGACGEEGDGLERPRNALRPQRLPARAHTHTHVHDTPCFPRHDFSHSCVTRTVYIRWTDAHVAPGYSDSMHAASCLLSLVLPSARAHACKHAHAPCTNTEGIV